MRHQPRRKATRRTLKPEKELLFRAGAPTRNSYFLGSCAVTSKGDTTGFLWRKAFFIRMGCLSHGHCPGAPMGQAAGLMSRFDVVLRIKLLHALRTDAMGEFCITMLLDIGLHFLPVAF